MMKIMAVFILFLVSFFIPYSVFAEELSLADLYELALQRSETIKIAEEDLFIARREKDRAFAVLLPTISAFADHTRYNEEKSRATFTVQPEYTTSWGLRLDQSFSLSGRELTAFKIAGKRIVKTDYDISTVKEDYLLSIAEAYYDVLKAKKSVEIANANVKRLTKHRDAAKTRLKVGETTKTVLLRAEAELLSAQADLIKAENALKLSKRVLSKRVGIEGDYRLKEPHTNITNPQTETLQTLIERAFTERAELKSLRLEKKIAKDEVKYTRGLYWPSLSVEGVYSRREDHPSSSFAIKESIYGGLKLDFPFFEGGLRRAEVRQARAKLRQVEYQLSDLKDEIAVEVEDAYLEMLTVRAILEKLEAEREYAEDNYHSVSKQFEYGLADSVDVMDANTLLVTVEKELANARYDYQFTVLRLKHATGTLLKTVLNELSSSK
jgi:outer membrane protein